MTQGPENEERLFRWMELADTAAPRAQHSFVHTVLLVGRELEDGVTLVGHVCGCIHKNNWILFSKLQDFIRMKKV